MPKSKAKILIIEDEKPLAQVMKLKLYSSGFTVKTVFNGESGLKEIKKTKFDLILCDLLMPKMNGIQFLTALKSLNIGTPVIILSNLSQEVDKAQVKALGVKKFLIKSNTSMVEIVRQIEKVLKIDSKV